MCLFPSTNHTVGYKISHRDVRRSAAAEVDFGKSKRQDSRGQERTARESERSYGCWRDCISPASNLRSPFLRSRKSMMRYQCFCRRHRSFRSRVCCAAQRWALGTFDIYSKAADWCSLVDWGSTSALTCRSG